MNAEYLVTGGGGFIGSNVVRTLVAQGRRVRVLDNLSTGRRENIGDIEDRIDFVLGDIRDVETVRRAVQGVRYVLHAAALPSVARSVREPLASNDVNITGTLNLLVAARDARVERLVYSSSSSVYGNTPVLPKREDMPPQPRSPYALTKLAGELYARLFTDLYGLPTFSLRYFNVFGPRQDPSSQYSAVIPRFIDTLHHGQPLVIYGDGRQTRDFTFVDDVVSENLCCCTAPLDAAGVPYNVAWGNRISLQELVAVLGRLMGKQVEPVFEPARAGDVRDSQADSSQAMARLGWKPQVSFEEGLRKTVEWFLSHP
ncbi:MAG TPA: SDR family oxidoreductase [Kiritimatiellia bacterium]|nr:SDR family oxidoreductase [Kiritimatiellia bacterium]